MKSHQPRKKKSLLMKTLQNFPNGTWFLMEYSHSSAFLFYFLDKRKIYYLCKGVVFPTTNTWPIKNNNPLFLLCNSPPLGNNDIQCASFLFLCYSLLPFHSRPGLNSYSLSNKSTILSFTPLSKMFLLVLRNNPISLLISRNALWVEYVVTCG